MRPKTQMRPQSYAWLLGLLAFAFFLRVLGQILVALDLAPFLPPMQAWYSGLVPYPLLLGSQIVILLLQVISFISRVWSHTVCGILARSLLHFLLHLQHI